MVKEFGILINHSILYCSKAAVQNHVRWESLLSISPELFYEPLTLLFQTAASKGLANHRAGRSFSKRSHNVNVLCMCNGIPLQYRHTKWLFPSRRWLGWALCASTVCRAPCQVDSQRLCGDWCQEEVSSAGRRRTKEGQETGTSPPQVSSATIIRYASRGVIYKAWRSQIQNLLELQLIARQLSSWRVM